MAESQIKDQFEGEGEASEWERSEGGVSEAGSFEVEDTEDESEVSEESEWEYPTLRDDGGGPESSEADEETFPQFPKLPIELRTKIWKEAMPGTRYIMIISTKEDKYWDVDDIHNDRPWFPICGDYAPALFFVCKEARAEVVKLYKPLKGTAMTGAIYMDVRKDVLCAAGGRCRKDFGTVLSEVPSEIRAGLTRIGVDCFLLTHFWNSMKDDLLKLPELAELYIGLFFNCPGRAIIGGFEAEQGLDEMVAKILERISSYDELKFDKLKESHPEWRAPAVTVGIFKAESLDDESEVEEEDNAYDFAVGDEEDYAHLPDIPDDGPDSGSDD